MNYYIILRGPAAVGKTTIGKILAKELNGKYFSFDKVLEENGLDYIPGEECVPEESFLKANNVLVPIIKNTLKNNQIAIIEGNFYHLLPLEMLIDSLDYSHFVFTLKADLKTCLEREKTRVGCGEDGVRDVFRLTSRFDYGELIFVDDLSPEEVVKRIKDKVLFSN